MDTTTHDHGGHGTTTHDHGGHGTTTHDHGGHHGTTTHGGHGEGGEDHTGGSHRMWMHAGFEEIIVFKGWETTNVGTFIASCFALFAIGMAYEGLKLARDQITRSRILDQKRKIQNSNNSKSLEMNDVRIPTISYSNYFIMLAFMTYNWWLCLSILLGIGVGFFFFGVRRTKIDLNEDCH